MFLGDRILGGKSAYSKVIYETCTRLPKLGHKIAHIPMGMANKMGIQTFKDILIYPSGNEPFGQDTALDHYINFKADMLITVKDLWVMTELYKWAFNFCPMVPVDHSPVSAAITSKLHTAFKVITISRFGQRELKQADIESYYIPHGVNVDLYKPLLERKAECKKMFFFDPDEFVVGIVARNQSRKMIPHMLRGYAKFREMNPDIKTHMMLWTDIRGASYPQEAEIGVADVGVDLLPEIMQLGLGEAIRWPDRKLVNEGIPEWLGENYVSGWDMVKLLNSFDVLLNTTGGEGAGLTQLEANACGVLPITSDYAGGPEYVGAGLTVKPTDYVIMNTPGTRFAIPDINGIAEALTKIYNADRKKLAKRARAFAERHSWDKIVTDVWKPFLDECQSELYPKLTKEEGLTTWA